MTDIPPELVAALIGLITAFSGYITYRTKTNTGQIAEIKTAISEQTQTTAIIDPNAHIAGQWSTEAREALQKAIPPGAEVVKIDDAPTYHIVYWRVKR